MNVYYVPPAWREKLEVVTYALQPIVNLRNGVVFGYEALLWGWDRAGFAGSSDLFDRAYAEGVLPEIELVLRGKAVETFFRLPWHGESKLFYSMDTRIWAMPEYDLQSSLEFFQRTGLPHYSFCFEVSENPLVNPAEIPAAFWQSIKKQGFMIAVDDCGAGFPGTQLTYYTEPHLIKIAPFFIGDLAEQPKKRIFVSNLVNIAHRMGALVVAEGVTTEGEAGYCRELGCDLLQGLFIEPPRHDVGKLERHYDHIGRIAVRDRRRNDTGDRKFIENQLIKTPPVYIDSKPFDALLRFKNPHELRVVPVINRNNEPMGVVVEDTLKPFAYSDYGRYLLQNPTLKKYLQDFMSPCPIADLTTSVDNILELYVQDESVHGVIITDQMQYLGFLDARALLKALNERNLTVARDQNPLSRLPGNLMINKFLTTALGASATSYVLVYFDLDNFKPFNDRYGFRNGDRVITLFADILRRRINKHGYFVGHVGGDDFFVGMAHWSLRDAVVEVTDIQRKFARDVKSFYTAEDRRAGFIKEEDREGIERRFPLLTVSAVLIQLGPERDPGLNLGEISRVLATLKKKAKSSPQKQASATL